MTKPRLRQLAGLLEYAIERQRKLASARSLAAGYDTKRDKIQEDYTTWRVWREALEAALAELDPPEESE